MFDSAVMTARGNQEGGGKDIKDGKDRIDPSDCAHRQLVKVEQSGVNEVDTDVLLYACPACGRSFTITDY